MTLLLSLFASPSLLADADDTGGKDGTIPGKKEALVIKLHHGGECGVGKNYNITTRKRIEMNSLCIAPNAIVAEKLYPHNT